MIFRFWKKQPPTKSDATASSSRVASNADAPLQNPPSLRKRDYSGSVVTQSPHVLVVDDGFIFLAAWEMELKGVRVSCFEEPQRLLEKISQDTHFLDSVSLIIIDHSYGARSKYNGLSFAIELRKHYFGPLFLSTEIPLEDLENIDLRIGKNPLSWKQLRDLISEVSTPT